MKPSNFLSKSTGLIAALTMLIAFTALPSTASARSSIQIDLPHFSIGFHDDHYGKRYRRSHRDHYYDRGSRYSKRHYKKRRYYNRRHNNYYNNDYYGNHYYGGSYKYRPRNRSYNRNYDYCPTDSYSRRYYRNSGCYSHGDHYHCDG